MARKIVDIGVEGNDGTGDSIREGFRKVNENFKEVYAVFGQEGTLKFIDLGDVESGQLTSLVTKANQIPIVNQDGNNVVFKPLLGANGLVVTYPEDPADPNYNKIVLTQQRATSELGSPDIAGKFGNVIDGQGYLLGNLADPTNSNVLAWNSAFGRSAQTNIGAEKFPVPLGFADNRYINKGSVPGEQADAMVGYLSVPAGASGDQAPQAAETVLKAGSSMSGKLFLNDHPGDAAGMGTPLGEDDLQAATKYYVDTTAYSSKVNLYVSTNGDDAQVKTPAGKEGRAWAYAYKSLVAACLKAEQLIDESPWETGPYRQLIAYGGAKYYSEIVSGGIIIGGGLNGTTRIKFTNDSGSPVDQGIPNNRDIIPGKLVVGRNSNARGFIVKYGTIDDTDYVDLRDVTGSFAIGENLFFDQAVKRLEISIFIESGNYFEDYPIRVPRNCSILGDEFRRTVIRPADRVSKSPWAATWFYRDLVFDNLEIADTNWGYHYLTDSTNKASTPKNNKDLDVFLMNDATIIRQISCQGHGGFMMVLDPNGQILTKSPYCQQSGCFSGSLNKQAFRGGQYVDGQAGSMPVTTVSTNLTSTEITVTDAFRVPQTPTAFFVEGTRYKIDTFTDDGEGYRGASDLLLANKEFIVAETIAYVNDVVTPTFTYDPIKFSQSVGNIINAVAWDLALDSNIESINIGQEYYIRTKYTTFPSEKTQTLSALEFVKESLVSLLASNATAVARAVAKMNVILQIIENGVAERTILDATSWSASGTTITVTRSGGHNLGAGWSVKIVDTTASTNAPNGIFNVASVVNNNTFTYTVANAPTGTTGGILRFTSSPIPIRSIPNPPLDPQALPGVTEGIQNSLAILLANRELIKAEYIAFIQTYYSAFLDSAAFSGLAVYIRDADRIVNAVIYDAVYGGNTQTLLVAKNYFDIEGKSNVSAEVTQIYKGLEWAGQVASKVVLNSTDFIGYNPGTQEQFNGLLQVGVVQTRLTAGTQSISTSVSDKFGIIITALRFGVDTLPSPTYPNIENVTTTIRSAKNLLDINANTIRASTIDYINNKYLYDVYSAQRDIRFLLDDIAHDIVYSGNLKVVEHGLSYFVSDAKLVSDAERPRTLDIIEYIKDLALAIVDNVPIPNAQFIDVGSLIVGQTYKINTPGNTVWTALGAVDNLHNTVFTATGTGLVTSTNFVIGRAYTIASLGVAPNQTNFVSIGSTSNAVGTSFIATGVGTGTGTATQGTGNVRLSSSSNFYSRQDALSQVTQVSSGSSGPALIVPSTTWVNINLVNAFQKLQDEKASLQAAVIAEINRQVTLNVNNPDSIWYDFEYNQGTCSRDVGYVIDAVGYDMMFNSNFRTTKAAIAYYRGTASATLVRNTQLAATVFAFNYLTSLLQSTITSAVYGQLAYTRIGTLMAGDSGGFVDIVDNGLTVVPAFVLTDPTGFNIDYSNSRRLISDNKAFIIDEIISWINVQIIGVGNGPISPFTAGFAYNAVKCAQDVGFIIDAILYDLTYGGNLETIVAANAYFVGVNSTLGNNEKDKTIAAYARLKEIIGKVAQAVTVLDKKTSLTQVNAVSGGGLLTSVAFAQARVQDIITKIDITSIDSKPRLETLIDTTKTMVANTKPAGFIAAKDLLVANRSFIQAEVYNFLKYTYTFTITATTNNQMVTASTAKMRAGMPIRFSGTDPFDAVILTASNPLEVDGLFVVKFEFARVATLPDATAEYEIRGNANSLYNLIVPVAILQTQAPTDTTYTSITVVYPTNPGVFDYANQTTIRVAGGTFGGVDTDSKYYVKEILPGGTNFTISASINGSTPGSQLTLDSDTGTMYCAFAFDEATSRRDTGYLVSNISTDILYGGRYNTIKSGKRYLVASSVLVVTEQSIECREGISYINTLAQRIINNQAPLVNYQTLNNVDSGDVVAQVIDSTKVGGIAASSAIAGLVTLINNIIVGGRAYANDIVDAVVYPKYVLQLNEDTPYSTEVSGTLPEELVMQAAGNTSMLSNDWTQLNDLAYGLVATNNGLIETVSVFTYYCWTAYYSCNGGQIRSVGGSNAHGEYALVAEGSDPFEVPDSSNLSDDMAQVAKVFKTGPFASEMGKTKTTVYIEGYNYLPNNVSEIEINHGYAVVDGIVTDIGITRYEIANVNDASGTYFSTSQPTASQKGINLVGSSGKYQVKFTFPAKTFIPDVGRYYTITGNSNTLYNNNFTGWLCVASSTDYITLEFTTSDPGTFGITSVTTLKLKSGTILRLNLNTSGSNSTAASGLQDVLYDNQLVVIRANQNFKFYNVDNISPTRPSTALVFRGDPTDTPKAPVYRVLAFNTKDPLSQAMTLTTNVLSGASSVGTNVTVLSTSVLRAGMTVSVVSGIGGLSTSAYIVAVTSDTTFTVSSAPSPALNGATIQAVSPIQNEVILTFDSGYNYIGLVVDQDHNRLTEAAAGIDGGSTTRTLGSKAGDRYLAIKKINSANELARILTGQMAFGWNGRIHRVSSYLVKTISSTEGYGIIGISETTADSSRSYQDISGYVGTGLSAPTRAGEGFSVSSASYNATSEIITYNISGLEVAPNAARFTGAINNGSGGAGTILTVSAVASGTVLIGSTITGITGTSVTSGTIVIGQSTCTASAIYSSSATGTSGTFTITLASGSASIINGQFVSGLAATITGLPTNTYVTGINGTVITLSNALTANISATVYFFTAGVAGTYTVGTSQLVSSQAMGVHYTVYGNSNISYNISGPILTSSNTQLTLTSAKATVVATITGTSMVVTYVSGNIIQLGDEIIGVGIPTGTLVTTQNSSTESGSSLGGKGTYTLSASSTVTTPTFTGRIVSTTLTVSAVASGTISLNANIQKSVGTGVISGTTIIEQVTGVNVFSTTATGLQNSDTIYVTSNGSLPAGIIIGQLVRGLNVSTNTYVKDININGITLTKGLATGPASGTYYFDTPGSTGTYTVDTVNSDTGAVTMNQSFIAQPGTFGVTSATRIYPTEKLYNPALVQDNTISLRTGLSKGEQSDIIVNISTCRVTGHDFSDIGTGGYNQTNYPNKIYGVGKAKNQKKEVAERGTGRVFWVATDQDGFFRVGRFFTVDQGTGTVTFAASLALSNLDGLGFKRGRAISEFSDDDTFQDLSDTKVPTEHAIDGYLNRRLGIDRNNVVISEGTLGAGFLDRNGIQEMQANLRLAGHYIENLGEITPTTPFNYAVTKRYVDNQQLSDENVDVDGNINNDLLVFNNNLDEPKWVNAKSSTDNSQIQVELVGTTGKELSIYVKRETIDNSFIREDANISQNKIDINIASRQNNQGVLLSGTPVVNSVPYIVTGVDGLPTGTSPHVLVKFLIDGSPTSITANIWYTVSGNSNVNYNGRFLCVASSVRVGGASAYVQLEYPEYPGVFGAGNTIVTPWETKINTQLPHLLEAGDNVLITGSVATPVTTTASGTEAGSRQLILTAPNSGVGTGQLVTGTNIPANTYVKMISGTNVTLTNKITGTITAASITFSSSINGNWLVKSVPTTTSFVITLDTRLAGAYTGTARTTKLGLAAFNYSQFDVTNGFTSIRYADTFQVTATITAGSLYVTVPTADMNNIAIGMPVTLASAGGNVVAPTVNVTNPADVTTNGTQPVKMFVAGITSATQFELNTPFVGTGSSSTAILTLYRGTPLGSLQYIQTDRVLGNISGSSTSPSPISTGQIVEAGDGIKNAEFNDNLLADVAVRGIMSIVARDTTYPHKNTYGVWNVTKTGAGNSIVRTTDDGAIEATQYILDGQRAIDTSNSSSIDFYTPGQAKFLTANGNSGAAATPIISIGTFTTGVNTTATLNSGGTITVTSKANMYVGQELLFSGDTFGNILPGTYYIVSISPIANTITISSSDSLTPVFTGAPGNGTMTVQGTTTNPGVLNGQVYVPNLKAYGNVIFNPINANISLQPRSTNGSIGTITMYPAVNGSINNMAIGALSDSTGKFTTVEITSVTDAANSTTGPLKVAGGAAIAKKLYVGGNFEVTGNALVTGNLIVKGITTTVNSSTVNIADKNIILAGVTQTPTISCDIDASGVVTNMVAADNSTITGIIPGMVITKDSATGATNNAVLGTVGAVATVATVISPTSITITVSAGSITGGKLIFTAAGGNNTTGDGGGITVKAASDKTLTWVAATDRWTSNVGFETSTGIQNTPIGISSTENPSGHRAARFTDVSITDNAILGSDNTDTITTNAYFVNGTQLKSAKVAANTLSLSAYDVNGTAYVDLVKLTSADEPKLELTSTALGTITNMSIGTSNHSTGKFTTLNATDTATFDAAVTMTGENKNVSFKPTGTGTIAIESASGAVTLKSTAANVTISSYTLGYIDGIEIGKTTAKVGTFTELNASNTVIFTSTTAGSRSVGPAPGNAVTVGGALQVWGGVGVKGDVYANKFYGTFEVPSGGSTIVGQIDGADKVKVISAANAAGPYYLAFVDSNNETATNEVIYSDGSLSYNASTNVLETGKFKGSLEGNADTATKVKTISAADAATTYKLTFVGSNNTDATAETVYTDASLSFKADDNTLTTDYFAGTFKGDLRGNLEMNDGTDIIARGTTAALSTFAGTAAKADQWTNSVTISFTGIATGSATFNGGTSAVSCSLTADTGIVAAKLAVVGNTTAGTRYLTFTDTEGGTSPATTTSSYIQASSNLKYEPGTKTLFSTTFSGNATTANYADLAENYLADAIYEEGTILVFGGEQEVTQSTVFNDRRVAGVVSLKPAYLMNNELVGDHVVAVALQGRVPVKVIGRVQKGDLLVSSGKPGYAIVNNDPKVGTVIGKSLAVKTTDGEGVVEAVVGKH